jgi:3-hydroxyisobutyrate dehydrogenase
VTEALPHLAEGAVVVDHTTTSAKVAREMAELAAASGRFFIDAPVSGGQAGAENGQLSVMAGGDAGPWPGSSPRSWPIPGPSSTWAPRAPAS